ncbi:FliM/FliN family flagellar motor C-terminal domain-containing protein [Henriciella sp. AS95]|uniref:FliM/FliN family flagellar motor C-terminal domain-containing protein n=1 Tax=Henriciella sp. AS95 TaxID=3135782 RepID=UPI0031821C1C
MSSVLLQKIRSAGGISPVLQQCAPLWSALETAGERWAKAIFDHELSAEVVQKTPLSGKDAEQRISERFGYICLPYSTTGLRAVALDSTTAKRYAAIKLKQGSDALGQSPRLFLRLMCDQPARALWKELTKAIPVGPELPSDFSVVDPAGLPDSFDPEEKLLRVVVTLSEAGGGEDGWLLEGGEESPELHLYYETASLMRYAANLQSKASKMKSTAGAAGQENLRKQMRTSSIKLDAVLERLQLSLADCSRFEVGQVLALPDVEPGILSLCAETMHGSVAISQAELGTWKGKRALKLTSPILESFAQEIAEI